MHPVFSVSEFNEAINHHLSLISEVSVEGEISQLNISQNKWVFITIKDQSSSMDVFGVAWDLTNLNQIEEGMLVKVTGTPGIYVRSGKFHLKANSILPSGSGAIQQALELLKKQLETEGLFDQSRKRPLPKYPQKIGLVTAKNSQAYRDVIKVLNHRTHGLEIFFIPVTVQGEQSVKSLTSALNYVNQFPQLDLLIITRGGGSKEDLKSFNNEKVVRAVFSSKIPTICAIGHEGDTCLAELVADMRASTPSNAAEIAVREAHEHLLEIHNNIQRISQQIHVQISRQRHLCMHPLNTLKYLTASQLDTLETNLKSLSQSQLHTIQILKDTKEKTLKNVESASKSLIQQLQKIKQENEMAVKFIHANNPQDILNRGYSWITNSEGELISSTTQVKNNQLIHTQVKDGTITSKVTKTNS